MANQWFRFYHEFQDDPKILDLSIEMRYWYVMLLCSRSKTEVLTDRILFLQWRPVTKEQVAEIKAELLRVELIDHDWNVLGWNKRQFLSDVSTDRVKKFREAKRSRNVSETRFSNGPEQNIGTTSPGSVDAEY